MFMASQIGLHHLSNRINYYHQQYRKYLSLIEISFIKLNTAWVVNSEI